MENLINYVTGGSETFTPSVIVGLIVFTMITESLCMLIGSVLRGVKR